MTFSAITDQVLTRYPILLTEANQRMSEPWFLVDEHTHERFKFKATLSAEILSSFRGRRYGGIGLDPNDFMISHEDWVRTESEAFVNPRAIDANYDENLRWHVFHFIKKLIEKAQSFPIVDKRNLLKLIVDEQPFGADRVALKIEGKKLPVSVFSARMALRTMHATAYYQTHASTPMKTVLELGGGFGRCLRDCLSINSIETAYYVDLPLNVGLAATYLEACFPGRVNLVWDAQDEIILGKINILVPWLIDKINEPTDLMINFLSLQHMPQVTMNHYFDTLISPKVKFLYHENRMQPLSVGEGEGSLLNVAARQQFTIHAGPEMETKLSYNKAGKKIGILPTPVAEFLVNKALQV
jgi:hypothetical protein